MAVGALAFCQAGRSLQWVSKVPLGTLQASMFRSFSVPFCTLCHCAWVAEGALAFAARPWQVFLVGFEGTVRHPPSVPVRSLFRRFLHAVPLRLGPAGRPGWLRPGRALAALVLAAGLWLRGPGESSYVWHPASRNFRLFFGPFCTPCHCAWPGRALAALVLAAGLWLRGPGESS